MENVPLPASYPDRAVPGAELRHGGGCSCGAAVPGTAESSPHCGISEARAFVIARRDVYKSGAGPRCLSPSRHHSPALPNPTLEGTQSERPRLGLTSTCFCKSKELKLGLGLCSWPCPPAPPPPGRSPLSCLVPSMASSRGSQGPPATASMVPGSSSSWQDFPTCFLCRDVLGDTRCPNLSVMSPPSFHSPRWEIPAYNTSVMSLLG